MAEKLIRRRWRHEKKPNEGSLYDTARWKRLRHSVLCEEPLCRFCEQARPVLGGAPVPATLVDHIIPHCGDKALFYDRSNLQPLCDTCHSSTKERMELGHTATASDARGFPLDPNHPWHTWDADKGRHRT